MAKKRKLSMKREIPPIGNGKRNAQVDPPVEAEPAAETDSGVLPNAGFPIVGIGAAVGGPTAFEAFFSAMPTDVDPDMAFDLTATAL